MRVTLSSSSVAAPRSFPAPLVPVAFFVGASSSLASQLGYFAGLFIGTLDIPETLEQKLLQSDALNVIGLALLCFGLLGVALLCFAWLWLSFGLMRER